MTPFTDGMADVSFNPSRTTRNSSVNPNWTSAERQRQSEPDKRGTAAPSEPTTRNGSVNPSRTSANGSEGADRLEGDR
ncbi:MAG: hypothetical protein ACYCU0_14860 [Solirubrobacteraceae bacterium]